jgi:hypothetical protein
MRYVLLATLALLSAACSGSAGTVASTAKNDASTTAETFNTSTTVTSAPSEGAPDTSSAPTTTGAPVASTAAPSTAPPATTPPGCDPSWSTAANVTAGWPGAAFSAPGRALQQEVRIGTHPGYDRFVIEFEEAGRVPNGWSIHWISGTPLHDGSGLPVSIAGNEFLEVRFLGSAGWAITDPAEWYSGPQELFGVSIGAANLVEAEMAGDYEGYVTWFVSADAATPFNVFTLAGPPRLVVDICH